MDKRELQVINKAVKEKYKYYKVWKILAIVFMGLTILFGTLYFASGDVFRQTTNNNDVEIVNNGDSNNNGVYINN
ncbi:MAG: hypothetical protein J6T74_02920 [Clostridia bacterium]|nr:hypothetical protein [Clostridia bacterium]MBO7712020.1 hypothetical protein [Methanobrevibacter sp.]MBO7712093.1 hypothetical protein [Methanobrevibacter sp.]